MLTHDAYMVWAEWLPGNPPPYEWRRENPGDLEAVVDHWLCKPDLIQKIGARQTLREKVRTAMLICLRIADRSEAESLSGWSWSIIVNYASMLPGYKSDELQVAVINFRNAEQLVARKATKVGP